MKYLYIILSILVGLFILDTFFLRESIGVDAMMAHRSLRLHETACKKDNGETWGESLCVPMLILDKANMVGYANQPDSKEDLKKYHSYYKGEYKGPQIWANTAFSWDGKMWSMVLKSQLPEDEKDRTQLLMHEAWHAIQEKIGFPAKNIMNHHLEKKEARVLIRLEWQALLEALKDSENIIKHISHALDLREKRYSKDPEARINENTMDLNEGLAEYTGLLLSGKSKEEALKSIQSRIKVTLEAPSMVRSFSYISGPLYGFILDEVFKGWRKEVKGSSLFALLNKKIKRIENSDINLSQYGKSEIEAFELRRHRKKQAKIKKYMVKIGNPPGFVIKPTKNASKMFNPYEIISVDKGKNIYITLTINDEWGSLTVTDGSYLEASVVKLSSPVKISASEAEGDGWKIKLKPQWTIKNQDGQHRLQKTNK